MPLIPNSASNHNLLTSPIQMSLMPFFLFAFDLECVRNGFKYAAVQFTLTFEQMFS